MRHHRKHFGVFTSVSTGDRADGGSVLPLPSYAFARSRFRLLLLPQTLDLPGSEYLRVTGLVHVTAPFPV